MTADLLAALDQTRDFVQTMHGMKQQFIDAGWTDTLAEYMVLAAVQAATAQSQHA